MKKNNKDISLLIILLVLILTLLLNDRIWKYEYSNWLTGKLSDIVGIVALPIFIAIVIPQTKEYITYVVGLLFLLWKLPIINTLIELFNSFNLFQISRTIDYNDLFVLLLIPIIHEFLINYQIERTRKYVLTRTNQFGRLIILSFAMLIFCSTSIDEPAYPKGDILIEESIIINGKTEHDIISKLKTSGLMIRIDSILYLQDHKTRKREYYQIEELILKNINQNDTLKNVNFYLIEFPKKTSIRIINCSVQNDWDLQNYKRLEKKTEKYKVILKDEFIRMIDGI